MSIQAVTGTIQIIIAPVVMITAYAIPLGGMQAQFVAIMAVETRRSTDALPCETRRVLALGK